MAHFAEIARNDPEAEAISVRPVSFNRNGALCA
jgi:hypothetical protein